MSYDTEVDYGPLAALIGVWQGDKGMDIAPEPDGTEENPYYETITYTAGGDLTNAESQVLSVVYYRQMVTRKSNNEVFHDQTGYWLWDARENLVMHSFVIPRAVGVVAGGYYHGQQDEEGNIIIEVSAKVDDPDWGIVQSPFMQKNGRTTAFRQKITVGHGKMAYSETTMLDIYGKEFEHNDDNELTLQ
jgi:hypothetical protein